jgi:4-hydroxybenzoate polyprenyltransferase
VEVQRPDIPRLKHLFKSMRPKQWTKNAFIFSGLVFSRNLFVADKLIATLQVTILFCLLSSSMYLVNDVLDRDKDRLHERKRLRPIAAGLVTAAQAVAVATLLAVVSLVWAYALGLWVGIIATTYLVQTCLYSLYFKRIVLVDIFVVSLGFVLRVLVGGVAIHVAISPWLLITTIMLALFLALAKRRHEITLLDDPQAHRGILAEYPLALVDQLITMVTACTVVVYSLYTFLATPNGHLIYTVPFVLFGIARYLYLIHRRDGGGEPESLVLQDVPLLVNSGLWAATTLFIMYFLNAR